MKKILLTSTLALFFNCFWSFQAIASDDARYPAYDFQTTVIYRSPELSTSLSPKPKIAPGNKVGQENSGTTSEKLNQSSSAASQSTHQSNTGFSFGSYLMIAIILFAVWAACKDSMSARPTVGAKPKPQPKAPTSSKTKSSKKQGDDVLVLSDNVTQCQASTAKGTRCTRDNNLQLKQQAVNQRNCRFAVCKQHNRDSFKPHASVLKGI